MVIIQLLTILIIAVVPAYSNDEPLLFWGYECRNNKCAKVKFETADIYNSRMSLTTCRLFCGGVLGTVWPKPTGSVVVGQEVVPIQTKVKFNYAAEPPVKRLWEDNKRRFRTQINSKIPDRTLLRNEGRVLTIRIHVEQSPDEAAKRPSLTYDTDESYSLKLNSTEYDVVAEINAKSFFGARHGLETLSQLIAYDENREELLILATVEITDAPMFKHRGLLLDTGRNYFSIKSLKRTIDAMAMSKLNTFHWHIVDASSFPLIIESQPDLHRIGAYSPRQVYTHSDIMDLVEYARARGVRIYPDFDVPGHAGEGWQIKNLTVCFNIQPWKYYCPLPPCGMLDPTNEEVYEVLEDIYRELVEIFDLDIFHMGGSQVILRCWMESDSVRKWMQERGWKLEKDDFVSLYGYFLSRALTKFDKVMPNKKIPILVWSSDITRKPHIDRYIDNSRFIVHSNDGRHSQDIQDLLANGYKMVMTNNDALFLDCGFGSTVEFGNNWCSPYSFWQKIYENRLKDIGGTRYKQILGAEAANWAEQLDEHTVDARFWPRGSALAERLWSDPIEDWRAAEARMLIHRARLVENGIMAEAIQPEWCLQNQDQCPKY